MIYNSFLVKADFRTESLEADTFNFKSHGNDNAARRIITTRGPDPRIFDHLTHPHSYPRVPNAGCVQERPCGGFCSPPRLPVPVSALADLPWIHRPDQATFPAQRELAHARPRARTTVPCGELVVWKLDLGDEEVNTLVSHLADELQTHLQSPRYPVDCWLGLESESLEHSVPTLSG